MKTDTARCPFPERCCAAGFFLHGHPALVNCAKPVANTSLGSGEGSPKTTSSSLWPAALSAVVFLVVDLSVLSHYRGDLGDAIAPEQ